MQANIRRIWLGFGIDYSEYISFATYGSGVYLSIENNIPAKDANKTRTAFADQPDTILSVNLKKEIIR